MAQSDASVFELRDNKKLYEVLGVAPTATEMEIKRAYYKLAVLYHPDKNPDGADKFKEISFANGILCDPEQRRMYDAKTLRNHVEGRAREYNPMMDPNVELSGEDLRSFVESLRKTQKDDEQRRREFAKKREEEVSRQAEFDQKNPGFRMAKIDVTTAAAAHMESFQSHQRTTADMMRALDELHSNKCSSSTNPHEVDLESLRGGGSSDSASSSAAASLKAKMLSEFRNTRRSQGHSTTEDLTRGVTEEEEKKFGFVKPVPSYAKTVKKVLSTRSHFDYTTFVRKDIVDGGVLTEAILADALGDYDPNS